MPKVILTGSIRQHVGGIGVVEVGGDTAGAVVSALEASYPALRGWIVDERGVAAAPRQAVLRPGSRFAGHTDRPQ